MSEVSWCAGIIPGNGYDEVRGEPKDSIAVTGTLDPPQNAAGQEGEFSLLMIQSEEDYDSSLGINADLGGGAGLFNASGKFEFKKRCKVSSQASFCVIRVVAKNAYEHLTSPKLTGDAWELLEQKKADRFRARFGDRYVSGQFSGVEFYGAIRIEAHTIQRSQEIAAKIQASYGFLANGSAGTSINESMASANHQIEVLYYQKGGQIKKCTSLTELFSIVEKVLDDSRTDKAYPFSVTTSPYDELKLPNDDASFVKIEAAKRNLKKLSKHMWALQIMQNDIDFVLRNQSWFVCTNAIIENLNNTNKLISAELNTIVDKADICSRDFNECSDYSPTYPVLNLPPRKPGVLTRAPSSSIPRPRNIYTDVELLRERNRPLIPPPE
jgi:hypothetical protein